MKKKLCVWIDDEKAVLENIKIFFELEDMECDCYSDPLEAACAAKNGEFDEYAIIVTDMKMPKMGGEELISIMRRHGISCKIFIASGHVSEEVKKRLIKDFNTDGFFDKPFSLREVVSEIKQSIGHKQ